MAVAVTDASLTGRKNSVVDTEYEPLLPDGRANGLYKTLSVGRKIYTTNTIQLTRSRPERQRQARPE
jgi:hypothetical protein